MFDIVVLDDPRSIKACFYLGKDHYEEVEKEFSHLPYQVNWPMVEKLIETKCLSVVAAFDGLSLIGYIGNLISPDVYSKAVKASELGMYVKESYRNQGVLRLMLEKSEEELIKLGVTSHYIVFKEGHEHNVPDGFVKTETTYMKLLEG